jgi:hypothetical protein
VSNKFSSVVLLAKKASLKMNKLMNE